MKHRIVSVKRKINSRAGESISETLVAVLISALALVMLAGAITTASRLVTQSRNRLESYYEANNVMAEMPDSDGVASSVYITESDGSASFACEVNLYRNEVFKNKPVSAYKSKR